MKLKVAGLSFSYASHVALSDVTFTLQPGEIMCVMGPNGAGKSTLLKCINRVLQPRVGQIKLDEEDLALMDRQRIARKFAYVPQSHPTTRLTVFETVLLGRKPHLDWKLNDSDYEIVEGVICSLGLKALAMRSMAELSGGEVQKVVFARALAQEPKVLLLDEPTSYLDLKNQVEVIDLLRQWVNQSSLSALVAIHDLNRALRFADSFLFLKENQVHSIVKKEELCPSLLTEVYEVPIELKMIGKQQVAILL